MTEAKITLLLTTPVLLARDVKYPRLEEPSKREKEMASRYSK